MVCFGRFLSTFPSMERSQFNSQSILLLYTIREGGGLKGMADDLSISFSGYFRGSWHQLFWLLWILLFFYSSPVCCMPVYAYAVTFGRCGRRAYEHASFPLSGGTLISNVTLTRPDSLILFVSWILKLVLLRTVLQVHMGFVRKLNLEIQFY